METPFEFRHWAARAPEDGDKRRAWAQEAARHLMKAITPQDLLRAAACKVSGSHVEFRQTHVVSELCGVTRYKALQWLSGEIEPTVACAWPLIVAAFLTDRTPQAQNEALKNLLGDSLPPAPQGDAG